MAIACASRCAATVRGATSGRCSRCSSAACRHFSARVEAAQRGARWCARPISGSALHCRVTENATRGARRRLGDRARGALSAGWTAAARRASSSAWIRSARCRWPPRRRSRASACRWSSPPRRCARRQQWGKSVDPAEAAQRVDLRALPLVTIDGEDAKDFDDAVYAERLEGGGFRLLVAIADVSHYVRPGSALDREARARGTSVYFPTRVLPMLPTALSNHLCSLEPQVDRLCMVADMRVSQARRARGEPLLSGGDALGGASDLYPGARGAVPRHSRRHARASGTLLECAAAAGRGLSGAARRRAAGAARSTSMRRRPSS